MQSLIVHMHEHCLPAPTHNPQILEAQHSGTIKIYLLLTQEPNIDFPGWVSLLGSSTPSIFWPYLLQVLSDPFIQQVGGEGEQRRLHIRVLWIRPGSGQLHCCPIPLPTTWPLGYPQLQGRLGNVGGHVPWRKREMILRTIRQFQPLIVAMMKMKLPLLIVLWKERRAPLTYLD